VHELSICDAIVKTATKHADGHAVSQVTVRIGHLRQVVPDALHFSWELLTDGTALKGSELVIEEVPARVSCAVCSATSTLDVPVLACTSCGSLDVTLVTGDEFLVVSLDIVEV
jgi:hydrogenase nickel incorporation protein HypA/HybF